MGDLVTAKERSVQLHEHEETSQYLTFLIGEERFAIGILDVKELIEVDHTTAVPMTPDFIRGVINLRGSVVPVIDLSARLGRKQIELSKRSCIVLVEIAGKTSHQTLGMLVDEVSEILEIPTSNILPPPDFGADIRTDFIEAMGRVGEEFIILLKIDRVLSIEEMSALKQLHHSMKDHPPTSEQTQHSTD